MIDDVTKEALGEEETALYQNAIDTINNVIQDGAKYAGTQMQNTGPSMRPANGLGGTLQYDWSRYANPNVQAAVSAIRTAAAQKALNDALQEMYRQARLNYQNAANNYNYNNGNSTTDVSNGRLLNISGVSVNGEPIDTSNTALITPAERTDAIRQAEEYLGYSPVDWDSVDWSTGQIIPNANTLKQQTNNLQNNAPLADKINLNGSLNYGR